MTTHRSPKRFPCSAALAAMFVLSALLAPARALAAPESYNIDPEHSGVGFSIRHLFSKVPGRFTKFEGSIGVDRSDFSKSQVQVTIDAASIDTNVAARDKHLRSDAFFDAANHPQITFRSTKVKQVAQNKLQVAGDLTIRGTTKPVTLDVEVLGFGPGYGGGFRGSFEAHTRINRKDFGVSWNDVVEGGGYVLGDDVDISLNVEAVREQAKPAQGATTPASS
jgi:polyisoprenoid-binding protein YceI